MNTARVLSSPTADRHVLPRNVWGRLSARVPMAAWTGGLYERLDAALARTPGIRRVATAWALIADRLA